MTVIDRYLVQIYAKVLLVSFASLVGLFVVIDGANNLDEFFTYGNHRILDAMQVMGEYYAPRTLQFFDQISGLLAMLAATFVISSIARTNELTAIMAAGIGPARVIRPLLAASIVVALLAAANREVGLPKLRDSLAKDKRLDEALFRLPPEFSTWGRQIAADTAHYLRAEGDQPAGYLFHGVK